MPVLSRYDWIVSQVEKGRSIILTVSPAIASDCVKLRIRMFDDYSSSNTSVFLLAPMLKSLRSFVSASTSTDRGHRHSGGDAEITIYLKAPPGRFSDLLKETSTGNLPSHTVPSVVPSRVDPIAASSMSSSSHSLAKAKARAKANLSSSTLAKAKARASLKPSGVASPVPSSQLTGGGSRSTNNSSSSVAGDNAKWYQCPRCDFFSGCV
mmetsp:Transcript_81662/g.134991  ORF Transcript_81662/g.134991 Transcript_81662/m.134991 type:complete len:209 (-) Transcript_81662:874-1500(-)